MNYSKKFMVKPGSSISLKDLDSSFSKKDIKKISSIKEIKKLQEKMDEYQYRLFTEKKHSLLIVLQAPDAGGKDGVVQHVIGSMNPQGCRVVSFKKPTQQELSHDFLWRIKRQVPKPGEVVIFN
ncbi:MAG: polyphosphate kinase 2 family protein, partial [Ignavibacteria bacterium]|nr:polyphosphate kinase 2 family protein [Ignavibacteria bacterium]